MYTISRSTGMKFLGAMGLIFLATQVYAEELSHEHREHNVGFSLNHGQKWETDKILRQGMDDIRQLMTANQVAIEKDSLGPQDYQRLGDAIDKTVTHVVKNCKLPKEADAAFHGIVMADLIQSAELMRTSPKIQAQRAGALGIQQSLRNYGNYFQHPGWRLNEEKSH